MSPELSLHTGIRVHLCSLSSLYFCMVSRSRPHACPWSMVPRTMAQDAGAAAHSGVEPTSLVYSMVLLLLGATGSCAMNLFIFRSKESLCLSELVRGAGKSGRERDRREGNRSVGRGTLYSL